MLLFPYYLVDNGVEGLITMNDKIGTQLIDWKSTKFVGSNVCTPVDGITFVLKRRYPSHSKLKSPYFRVDPHPHSESCDPVFLPIYKLGFNRAWKMALSVVGGGEMAHNLVRYARRAPPIENYVLVE